MPTAEVRKPGPAGSHAKAKSPARAALPRLALDDAEASSATDCRTDAAPGEGANPFGTPGYLRRLSDKILAAFNHAYAAGEAEIAYRLHDALVAAEQQARLQHPERRFGTALAQAGLWVAYVDARNRYLDLAQDAATDSRVLTEAETQMTLCHRRWSEA